MWDSGCEEAFKKLKEICTSTPITYQCLYHNEDGIDQIIGYASMAHGTSEHRYLAHKLKLLALKWAVMEQFHEYLYGNTFVYIHRQ